MSTTSWLGLVSFRAYVFDISLSFQKGKSRRQTNSMHAAILNLFSGSFSLDLLWKRFGFLFQVIV